MIYISFKIPRWYSERGARKACRYGNRIPGSDSRLSLLYCILCLVLLFPCLLLALPFCALSSPFYFLFLFLVLFPNLKSDNRNLPRVVPHSTSAPVEHRTRGSELDRKPYRALSLFTLIQCALSINISPFLLRKLGVESSHWDWTWRTPTLVIK